MVKPVIGVTLDLEESGGYAATSWYALRKNYCSAIVNAGGVPILLPQEISIADHYFDIIDGILLTGGAFDIPPSMYGENIQHETVTTKADRTNFEAFLANRAIKEGKPLLGICGGEQLINVVLGGTLIQHIPDSVDNALIHEQKERFKPSHKVKIMEGTLLHRIVSVNELGVNTSHHQAISKPADAAIVNAIATDGIIEGIEYPYHPFCLGVQWHPEYDVNEGDKKIFRAFIDAAR